MTTETRYSNRELRELGIRVPMVGTLEFNNLVASLEKKLNRRLTKKERRYIIRLSHVQNADKHKQGRTRTFTSYLARKTPGK